MTTKNQYKGKQSRVHTFDIDFMSYMDDARYQGAFTTKKLSIADISALGVRKAQLNGGLHYDDENPGHGVDLDTDYFNNMIAHLELSLVKAPSWWNLQELTDVDLIRAVYKEVAAFEETFLNRARDAQARGSMGGNPGNSESSVQEPVATGSVGAVVESEVQSSLEP